MSNLSSWVSTTTAVSRSGAIRSNAASGHSTMISSALGTRLGVAYSARASTQIVCQPSSLRGGAQRLAGVDGADDDESRRRPEYLCEHFQALVLEQRRFA